MPIYAIIYRMKLHSKIICTLLFLILFMTAFSIHLDVWGTASSLEESIDHIIHSHRIPYCNVAIYSNGETEFINDTLTDKELTPTSIFSSGAVTEIITGLALNLLIDKKKLSLDSKITDFYPWLTFTYDGEPVEITVGQLASHSSGIPLSSQDSLYGEDKQGMLRSSMWEITGMNLGFLPGTAYRKSDSDYAVLAFIIEKVTGVSWSKYVTENVIKPLGLKNTYLTEDEKPEDANVVSGSRTCAGFIINHGVPQNSVNVTVRGVKTCVEDITRLMMILLNEVQVPENLMKAGKSLLSKENCAFSPEDTGTDAFFGGIFTGNEQGIFYNDDEMEEYSTSIWLNTEKKEAVAVQCSGMRAPSTKILENCRKKLDDKDDFLLSFISIETYDIIYSFFTIIVLFLCLNKIVTLSQDKARKISKARNTFSCIAAILFMIATALFPMYFDISYRVLYYKSVLTLTVFIACSQLFGILAICNTIKNRTNRYSQPIRLVSRTKY